MKYCDKNSYYVRFLGKPDIFINGEKVVFPFLKVKILALLLIAEGNISRDRVTALLWSEKPYEAGRRNLNNALCCLRNLVPFFNTRGDIIGIIKDAAIDEDIKRLHCLSSIEKERLPELFEPYMDLPEFENMPLFEEWLELRREQHRKILIDNMYKRAKMMLQLGAPFSTEDAVMCYEYLARLEPYDEVIHGELVSLYIKSDRKLEAARVAHEFSCRMEKELGINEYLKSERPFVSRDNGSFAVSAIRLPINDEPLARNMELLKILSFFSDTSLKSGTLPSSVLIWGEEGIGKSSLIKEAASRLERNGWTCFFIRCYQEEKNRPLASFTQFLHLRAPNYSLDQETPFLTEGNIPRIVQTVLNNLTAGSDEKRLLIVENIQWMDSASWMILEAILWNLSSPRFLLVSGYEEVKSGFMYRTGFVNEVFNKLEISLERFSREETGSICRQLHPDYKWSDEQLDEVYLKTDGNPFFIREYLNCNMNAGSDPDSSSDGKAQRRFLYRTEIFSETEKLFLNALAVSGDGASMLQLSQILDMEPMAIAGCYKNIKFQGLLRELYAEDGDVLYSFTHPRIREDLLSEMSSTLQRALNLECIKFLENKNPGQAKSWQEYSLLISHCAKTGLYEQELKWRIRELRFHFQNTYVVSPVLSDQEISHFLLSHEDTEYTLRGLNEARIILDKLIRRHGRTPELISYEIALLTLEGGYCWWKGNFTDASMILKEALKKALQNGGHEVIIDVCEQFCYLAIQSGDSHLLNIYSKKIYVLAISNHYHVWVGTALCFLATYHIMKNSFKSADKLLRMSVKIFDKIEESGANYSMSLIASEHTRGNLQIARGDYGGALRHFKTCISMGESLALYRGQGMFLAKAAYCLLRLDDNAEAELVLRRAERLYCMIRSERISELKGGGIAYSLLGYIEGTKGNWDKCREYWDIAQESIKETSLPTWRGIFYWTKWKLLEKNRGMPDQIKKDFFHQEIEWYKEEAQKILSKFGWNC